MGLKTRFRKAGKRRAMRTTSKPSASSFEYPWVRNTLENQALSADLDRSGADSGAHSHALGVRAAIGRDVDAELTAIAEAWPTLPLAIRVAMIALVRAAWHGADEST